MKSESGPDHRKRFLVEVRLKPAEGEPGKALARGIGSTKKHAEQDAARRALARLMATAQSLDRPQQLQWKNFRPADDDLSAVNRALRRRGFARRNSDGAGGAGGEMSTPVQVAGEIPQQLPRPVSPQVQGLSGCICQRCPKRRHHCCAL